MVYVKIYVTMIEWTYVCFISLKASSLEFTYYAWTTLKYCANGIKERAVDWL